MQTKRLLLLPIVVALVIGGGVASAIVLDPSSSPEKKLTGVQSDAAAQEAASDSNSQVSGPHLLPCTTANQPANFRVFALGGSFAGLPYTDTLRRCASPQRFRANYVSLVYGDCTATPNGSGYDEPACPLPVEVQSSPACERNAASYGDVDGTPLARKGLTIRGVPAAVFDDGTRVEVYTDDTTVVIFATTPALALQAANRLQPMPTGTAADARPTGVVSTGQGAVLPALAPPLDGAMNGSLTCTAESASK